MPQAEINQEELEKFARLALAEGIIRIPRWSNRGLNNEQRRLAKLLRAGRNFRVETTQEAKDSPDGQKLLEALSDLRSSGIIPSLEVVIVEPKKYHPSPR